MKPSIWLLGLVFALSACAPATRVVLLPEAGSSSSVEVNTTRGRVILDQPYTQANISSRGALETAPTTAEDVQSRHGHLLAASPLQADAFTLHFETGGTRITPESEVELNRLLTLAQERPGAEIVIVGHTDRVGSDELNDRLSRSRAGYVREQLIQRGFDPRRIEAAGRGSRDPVIPTDVGVSEPRNRRTEVLVR